MLGRDLIRCVFSFMSVLSFIFTGWLVTGRLYAQELEQRTIYDERGIFQEKQLRPVGFKATELITLYQEVWNSFEKALLQEDWSGCQVALDRLIDLRWQLGGVAFESQSLWVVDVLNSRCADYDRLVVLSILEKAGALAPLSAKVAWKIGLVHFYMGYPESALKLWLRASVNLLHDSTALTNLFIHGSYPLLYALGLSFYLLYVLIYLSRMRSIIGFLRLSRLPAALRGFVPLFLLLILVLPLAFGLIWTLVVWTLLYLWFFGRQSWLPFIVAVWFFIFGAVIPLRENALMAFRDQTTVRAMAVAAGNWQFDDIDYIREFIKEWPDRPLGHYALGLALLNRGKYQSAEEEFDMVGEDRVSSADLLMLKGVAAFYQGDLLRADQLMQQAGTGGLDSAVYYYNYSRIKFERLDNVASRELLRQARLTDDQLTAELLKREDTAQSLGGMALQQSRASLSLGMGPIIFPRQESHTGADRVAGQLMPALSPLGIMGAGGLLLIAFFARKKTAIKASDPGNGYWDGKLSDCLLAVFPAGNCLRYGRDALAVPFVWIILLLLFPLLGWPVELAALLDGNSNFLLWYLVIVACFVLFAIALGCVCCSDKRPTRELEEIRNVKWNY